MNKINSKLKTRLNSFSAKALMVIASSVLCLPSAFAKEEDFTAIAKDLEIMNSVLITALKQNSEQGSLRFKGLQSTYLANQGVVFEVDTSAQRWLVSFRSHDNFPSALAPPPPPPLPAVRTDDFFDGSVNVEVNGNKIHAASAETLNDLAVELNETMSQLRVVAGNSRDLTWKLRDLEREKQDLNFELRNAEKEREKEINEKIATINKEQAEIKRQQEAQLEEISRVKKEQKEQQEKRLAASKKARQAFLVSFEKSIASNLCRFGAGLRALPSDENITFILEGFNQGAIHSFDSPTRSRIYVFSANNMKKCAQQEIDENAFLSTASVYDF